MKYGVEYGVHYVQPKTISFGKDGIQLVSFPKYASHKRNGRYCFHYYMEGLGALLPGCFLNNQH